MPNNYTDTKVNGDVIFNILDSSQYDSLRTNNGLSSNQFYLITDDGQLQDLTIQLNGGQTTGVDKFVYNGSGQVSFNITAGSIGAAIDSHYHGYINPDGELEISTNLIANAVLITDSQGKITGTAGDASRLVYTVNGLIPTSVLPALPNRYVFDQKITLLANPTAAITDGTNDFILPSSGGTIALQEDIAQAILDLPDASTSARGLMTTAQVTKLNGIAAGAEVNQNAFSKITIKRSGQSDVDLDADSKTDTFIIEAGDNITIEPTANSDKIRISADDTIYTHPTGSGNNHIPAGGSTGQLLKYGGSAGTAAWGTVTTTTVYSMTSEGSVVVGTATTPTVIDTTKFSGGSFTQGTDNFTTNVPTLIDTDKFIAGSYSHSGFSGGSYSRGSFDGGTLTFTIDSSDTKKCIITFVPATHANDSFTPASYGTDSFTAPRLQDGFYSPGSAASFTQGTDTYSQAQIQSGFYTAGVTGTPTSVALPERTSVTVWNGIN